MRCFIAAWPDEPTRLALSSLSDTLANALNIAACHVPMICISRWLSSVTSPKTSRSIYPTRLQNLRFTPFAWQLDTLGFFKEAGVVWIGSARETTKPLATISATESARCSTR